MNSALEQLKEAYAKVGPYQPLYGVPDFPKALRETKDRCDAIYDYFDKKIDGVRFLDVGCSSGYLSLLSC